MQARCVRALQVVLLGCCLTGFALSNKAAASLAGEPRLWIQAKRSAVVPPSRKVSAPPGARAEQTPIGFRLLMWKWFSCAEAGMSQPTQDENAAGAATCKGSAPRLPGVAFFSALTSAAAVGAVGCEDLRKTPRKKE